MPRGGYRKNAGRKKKWNHGETTSIRVPIVLVDQILKLAEKIDNGGNLENETKSNIIDLSGIPLISVNGKKGIALLDLLIAGYEIKPIALANTLRNEYLRGQNESK